MKLSRSFLNDYLDTSAYSDFQLADNMLNLGNEYASVERLSSASKLVIGEVLDCNPHPDSDHLSVCLVNVGDGKDLQIVCGAPNVRSGIKVVVSLIGAVLAGDFEIKQSIIRGVESNGMICSLAELGIEDKYLSQEDREGIHILDDSAAVGGDPLAFLNFDDTIIDFELTSNRGDLLSVIGMAHEANIFIDSELKLPDLSIENETGDIKDQHSLEVLTENVSLYLARKVKDIKIKESPAYIKARLIASGIRPINNVVDISNYVMLEYGQPLHFFDSSAFDNKIIVRMAKEGESLTTLDGVKRDLLGSDIVITSEKEITALAGVMGGLSSEVELDTKDIIIESAIFNSSNIRQSSKRILRSEASNRFEKGINYENTYAAIDRACSLLEKYADAKVIAGTLVHDKVDKTENKIDLSLVKLNQVLGMDLKTSDVKIAFDKLRFEHQEKDGIFSVVVPPRRLDIFIPEDLIEEIGRVIGINKIESSLPRMESTEGIYDKFNYRAKQLAHRLRSMGLYETINYSLVAANKIDKFSNIKHETIEILSPMSDDRKILRTSLIPSLIDVYDYNYKHNNKDLAIYELSNIYIERNAETTELSMLSALVSGIMHSSKWQDKTIKADYFYIKGIVENLLDYLGLKERYSYSQDNLPKEFHPYQASAILVDKKEVGYFGRVSPEYSKYEIYVLELNLNLLLSYKVRNIKNREISIYPNIEKDLAFVVDKDISSEKITKLIKRQAGRLLVDIELFDYYEGENIEDGKKSLAYNLVFNDANKTLRDDEVSEIIDKTIKTLAEEGIYLREK